MPEGDTVWRACRQLQQALGGERLTRCEFRVPQLATIDLTGITVLEVVPRGKHQLFRFGNGFSLHTHLRMDGAWRVFSAGQSPRGPDHQIRVLLGTAAKLVVGYRLPVVELLPTAEEASVVGHLGPDLLGPDWDIAEAVTRITADPDRSIGEALLDQRNMAGLGTLYRAELLYLLGIHPRTPVGQLTNLRRVCALAQQLLLSNRERPQQATTGDLRSGRQHYVFERTHQPCRRCGTLIKFESFGSLGQERNSYWCPRCQPERS